MMFLVKLTAGFVYLIYLVLVLAAFAVSGNPNASLWAEVISFLVMAFGPALMIAAIVGVARSAKRQIMG